MEVHRARAQPPKTQCSIETTRSGHSRARCRARSCPLPHAHACAYARKKLKRRPGQETCHHAHARAAQLSPPRQERQHRRQDSSPPLLPPPFGYPLLILTAPAMPRSSYLYGYVLNANCSLLSIFLKQAMATRHKYMKKKLLVLTSGLVSGSFPIELHGNCCTCSFNFLEKLRNSNLLFLLPARQPEREGEMICPET